MKYLNQPFVLWLLSSVVLGLISFFYANWSENTAENLRNERLATDVFLEAKFRMDQMDETLRTSRRLESEGENENAVLMTSAMVHLGGIVSFPADDNGQVWVGNGGVGRTHLPFGQGYRDELFKSHSLLNLWHSFHSLTCGGPPSDEKTRQIDLQIQALKGSVPRHATKEEGRDLVTQTRENWPEVRETLEMFSYPNPRLDVREHCQN